MALCSCYNNAFTTFKVLHVIHKNLTMCNNSQKGKSTVLTTRIYLAVATGVLVSLKTL